MGHKCIVVTADNKNVQFIWNRPCDKVLLCGGGGVFYFVLFLWCFVS